MFTHATLWNNLKYISGKILLLVFKNIMNDHCKHCVHNERQGGPLRFGPGKPEGRPYCDEDLRYRCGWLHHFKSTPTNFKERLLFLGALKS